LLGGFVYIPNCSPIKAPGPYLIRRRLASANALNPGTLITSSERRGVKPDCNNHDRESRESPMLNAF
jgi:hypothetical protein